jgi:hypothetical protein
MSSISRKKEQGGMGIPDLRDLNLCLLAAWVQRYQDGEGRLWRDIIDFKYDVSPNIFCCNTRNPPPPWKGVAWAAQAAKLGFRWYVGDGKNIRF